VTLRIITMPIQSQGIITRDNVSVDVSAVAYFRVVDAVKAITQVADYNYATGQIAQYPMLTFALGTIAANHPDATVTGDPATQVPVPDHGAIWQYDPGSKQYLKSQDGGPFMNVGTGRVHAKTVIVEYVNSYLDLNPANAFHGYHTEAYELTGDGKADIYVDGVVMHATWHHPDPNVPTVYLDATGNPIDLDTGLTWVHVIGSEKWHAGL